MPTSFADIPDPNDVMVRLIQLGGEDSKESDRRILDMAPHEVTPPIRERGVQLGRAALRGFFQAATHGEEFCPSALIQSKFGGTLESNYPEAGEQFLRFARSYWTLKLITDHQSYAPQAIIGHELLSHVEQNVASVFFPTPGPAQIDPKQREQTQRELLQLYAPNINIDAFIAKNPILLRGRGGAGCMGGILLLIATGVGLIGFVLVLAV